MYGKLKHINDLYQVILHCWLCYSRIAEGLEQSLPKLETIVLTNNNIEDLVRIAMKPPIRDFAK